jgi:hypothetical protein
MKKAERAELRRLHEGFTMSGYASKGQYEDSRTILKLLDRIERLERALGNTVALLDGEYPGWVSHEADCKLAREALGEEQ